MTEINNNTDPSNSVEGDEELLQRLKAANPVPPTIDDDVSWTAADTLFDQITSRSGGFAPYADSAEGSAEAVRPPRGQERGRGRLGLLAAVAAVAALVVAAAVIVAPSGVQPALAVVQAAAQETAEADSGRVITAFSVVGEEDAERETLTGTVTALFSGDDFAVTIGVDPSSDAMSAEEAAEISRAETRVVDGQLYATPDGAQWMSIEAPEILQSTLTRLTDLRSILAQVEELVDVETLGPTEIDGRSVTHYRSEVDLADESLAESGWLPGTQGVQGSPVDIDAEGLVTVDMFVDEDGLMRRIEVSGEAEPVDESINASADFAVTTDFVDLGADLAIEAPDPSVVEPLDFDVEGRLDHLDD